MSDAYDEPIPYTLTEAGRTVAARVGDDRLVTATEAAVAMGWSRVHVQNLARAGRVEAVWVNGVWLVDLESLWTYVDGPREPHVPVDAEPLLRMVAARGGSRVCGVVPGSAEAKALERARAAGSLSIWMADRLAVQLLGLTLWDLWPEAAAG